MAGTYRNNLSVLPLYDSLQEQLHRRPYSGGYIYPIYVHPQKLIPFFTCWVGDTTDLEISKINIYKVCDCGDTFFREITCRGGLITPGDFNIDFSRDFSINTVTPGDFANLSTLIRPDFTDYSIIYYTGKSSGTSWNLPRGQFYLEIILNNNRRFYSEVFTVVSENELSRMVVLEWSDFSNLLFEEGYIPYENGYVNRVYLNTAIGKPEYSYEEEGKDRNGYFFPEKQLSKKTFNFKTFAPESLCDSLRMVGLSDTIWIEDPEGRIYRPTSSFDFGAEWLEDGYLAEIQCEFNTNTVIKTVGKPINI